LRAGRTASQLTATVRNANDDGPGHVTTAVFGAVRRGFEFTDLVPPDAPPPEDCRLPDEPPPAYRAWRSSAFENLEWRRVRSHSPWETDWEAGGPAEVIRWMRYRETPRLADGRVDPLALLPLADTMPGSVGQKLGRGYPLFFGFSCDLTVHFFEDTKSDWFLQRIHCRRAVDGYASAETELWDIDRHLVAWGTQMMFLAFPKE
jgi:acyl-CoA thioesterase